MTDEITPSEERRLLLSVSAGLEGELREAYERLISLIADGVPPRDAVEIVMDSYSGEMASIMGQGLTKLLSESVGTAAALQLEVGRVTLSRKVYDEGQRVSAVVEKLVRDHAAGFADARRLALELFEGYAFRPPDAEPLQFNPSNPRLPKYLREALLPDAGIQADMRRAFARIQVNGLQTPALRAAYSELLDAVDKIAAGKGKRSLDKKIEVAFFERMRYFSQRIAQTELHRAYAEREARLLLDDDDVEFVQLRRAPGGVGDPCICVLMTERNLYGLGPGIYPKGRCPVPPFHPYCRCRMSPRLDLSGRTPQKPDGSEDAYFLDRLGERTAARVMGSQSKRDRVLQGSRAEDVYNASLDPLYRLKTADAIPPARLVSP